MSVHSRSLPNCRLRFKCSRAYVSAFCWFPYWWRWQKSPPLHCENSVAGLNFCDVLNTSSHGGREMLCPCLRYIPAQQNICTAWLPCHKGKLAKFPKTRKIEIHFQVRRSYLRINCISWNCIWVPQGTSGKMTPAEPQHLIDLRLWFSLEHIGIPWRRVPRLRSYPRPLTPVSPGSAWHR